MFLRYHKIEEWKAQSATRAKHYEEFSKIALSFLNNYATGLAKKVLDEVQVQITYYLDECKLAEAIVAAIDDLERMSNYHNYHELNDIKKYTYLVYWINRFKPIFCVYKDNAEGFGMRPELLTRFIFINESAGAAMLTHAAFPNRKNVSDDIKKNSFTKAKKQLKAIENKLLYTLIYREHNAKTLEAIVSASTILPPFSPNPQIWKKL